jgi:ribosomal protein S18 acetylase RimI-like enzyme
VIVRCPAAGDRTKVHEALTRCGAFTDEEVRVAIEMFDAGLTGDYSVLVVDSGEAVCAYACFGKASLTERTWYLYWICVDRAVQGSGIGQVLARSVEDSVRQMGGDRLVIETSGRPDYARSRRFYERAGFSERGRLPDFYKPGDDCVLYCKVLGAAT